MLLPSLPPTLQGSLTQGAPAEGDKPDITLTISGAAGQGWGAAATLPSNRCWWHDRWVAGVVMPALRLVLPEHAPRAHQQGGR